MNISLIGSGNVATALGKSFITAGHRIKQVWSRDQEHANSLAEALNASPLSDLARLDKDLDLLLIAVSDAAIEPLAARLWVEELPVFHTAGSVAMNTLQNCSRNYGVFYPLQSLRKEMAHLPEIPVFIQGNNSFTKRIAYDLALSITTKLEIVNDETRKKYHLAAVLVSNFTNFLFTLASEYCKKEGLNFDLLKPLIELTALRLRDYDPESVQTGPAIRGDQQTIESHLNLLKDNPALADLYKMLTTAIQDYGKQYLALR